MKFTIKNENHQYLALFEEYNNSVAWIENDKMHKYNDERFEFTLNQVIFAFYLKFKKNPIYQHKLVVHFA